jgi:hypothetical protein
MKGHDLKWLVNFNDEMFWVIFLESMVWSNLDISKDNSKTTTSLLS